jgi:cytochrome c oxidase subunit 2
VIKITAKKFEYSPNEIRIKKGVPAVFEFTSLDRVHGFTVPDLDGVRLTIEPGKVNRVTIMAPKAGTYEFHCDLFCVDVHEGMTGTIIVTD